ncbi:MAG: hypothetical protein L0H70_05685 [Xanthomonadales bacterium]|nr:hypothetical protein [Xanthomonadales bacterium]
MPLKTIRSKADLAINGAPPAFDEPLHVGRPNIGDREAFLQRGNQILNSKWLTNNGPMVQAFERRIAVDEVQRAPGLLQAIKKSVDENLRPGQGK